MAGAPNRDDLCDCFDKSKDVVFGLGAAVTLFRRDSLYRELISKHWRAYTELPNGARKDQFVRVMFVDVVVAKGGRFAQVTRDGTAVLHPVHDIAIIVKNLMQALRDEKKQQKKYHVLEPPSSSSNKKGSPASAASFRRPSPSANSYNSNLSRRSSYGTVASNSNGSRRPNIDSRKRRNSNASRSSAASATAAKKPRRTSSSSKNSTNNNNKRKSTSPATTAPHKKPAVVSATRPVPRATKEQNANTTFLSPATGSRPPGSEDRKLRFWLPQHEVDFDKDVVFYQDYVPVRPGVDNRGFEQLVLQHYHEYRKTSRRSRFVFAYCKIIHPIYREWGGRFFVQHKDGWCTLLYPSVHKDLAEIERRVLEAFAKEKVKRKMIRQQQQKERTTPIPQKEGERRQQQQQQQSTPTSPTIQTTPVAPSRENNDQQPQEGGGSSTSVPSLSSRPSAESNDENNEGTSSISQEKTGADLQMSKRSGLASRAIINEISERIEPADQAMQAPAARTIIAVITEQEKQRHDAAAKPCPNGNKTAQDGTETGEHVEASKSPPLENRAARHPNSTATLASCQPATAKTNMEAPTTKCDSGKTPGSTAAAKIDTVTQALHNNNCAGDESTPTPNETSSPAAAAVATNTTNNPAYKTTYKTTTISSSSNSPPCGPTHGSNKTGQSRGDGQTCMMTGPLGHGIQPTTTTGAMLNGQVVPMPMPYRG